MTEHAYSTDNPEVVTAYRITVAEFNDCGRRARESAARLGKNSGPLIVTSRVSAPRVVGLSTTSPNDPPDGWRYSKSEQHLVPRRGRPGEPARRWLDAHQPPDLRAVLERHGLPRTCKPGPELRWFLATPGVFEHDGTVWALYPNEPDGECTWTPRKLSEFHAAREAMEAAEQAAREVVSA